MELEHFCGQGGNGLQVVTVEADIARVISMRCGCFDKTEERFYRKN
ncbi:MAG: hypothetical protein ACJAXU_001668 [Paracoccaceae bacterium]